MPEGDSVWRAARLLDQALSDEDLVLADLRWPRLSELSLVGRHVRETVSVGKHLLTRLDPDGRRPGLTLHTHLRMEGRWRVAPVGQLRVPGPRSTARVVLGTRAQIAIGFALGMVDLVATSAEDRVVGHLGPDILGRWDPDEALRRLLDQPDRLVGDALLDQRLLAGLGTYWASECLYVQGISPTIRVGEASALPSLLARLPTMLGVSRRPAAQVYGLRGRACRRCGTPVEAVRVGADPTSRTLYRCPVCQPG